MEQKAALIDELDTDPRALRARPESTFSIGLFVVLMLVFWPFGVGYALWHWHMQSSGGQI
jgi:hypothetical protein